MSLVQPQLGLPCEVDNLLFDGRSVLLHPLSDFGSGPVTPCRFAQDTARHRVARLRDPTRPDGSSAGKFTGTETEVSHETAGMRKTAKITDLGNDGRGDGRPYAPQCLQSQRQLCPM